MEAHDYEIFQNNQITNLSEVDIRNKQSLLAMIKNHFAASILIPLKPQALSKRREW